jgi:hypothetical protein
MHFLGGLLSIRFVCMDENGCKQTNMVVHNKKFATWNGDALIVDELLLNLFIFSSLVVGELLLNLLIFSNLESSWFLVGKKYSPSYLSCKTINGEYTPNWKFCICTLYSHFRSLKKTVLYFSSINEITKLTIGCKVYIFKSLLYKFLAEMS